VSGRRVDTARHGAYRAELDHGALPTGIVDLPRSFARTCGTSRTT
jgi:hypothetical protein